MALQSSGQITLNQIHIEAGGTSGTQASLNDTDIRSLAGISSGQIAFNNFYGASSGAEFVAAVTRREDNEAGIDSSSQAINLTGAGVQTGDLVVIAITADTSDHTNMNLIGMSEVKLHDSGNNLPVSLVFYGYWAAGNSNPYLDGTGGNSSTRLRAMSLVAGIFRNTNTSLLNSNNTGGSSGMPDPPSLTSVAGTKIIICTGHLDDDEVLTVSAPSGFTKAGSIATDPFTRGGVTGSTTMMAYKITTTSVNENPGAFGGNGNDYNDSVTMRF